MKIPGVLLLVFSFAAIKDLRLLPLIFAASLVVYILSGLPAAYMFNRLRFPGIFLLFLALVLPFWSGETVLWQLGPLALRQEGLLSLLLILVKFISIFAVVIALFATTPLPILTKALRKLGIPWLLTDLLLFTYRYLFQLTADLQRMRTAARLRGLRSRKVSALKSLANITGTMLVRSQEQSEKVAHAMTLRGYGREELFSSSINYRAVDTLMLTAFLGLSGFFFLLQYVIL